MSKNSINRDNFEDEIPPSSDRTNVEVPKPNLKPSRQISGTRVRALVKDTHSRSRDLFEGIEDAGKEPEPIPQQEIEPEFDQDERPTQPEGKILKKSIHTETEYSLSGAQLPQSELGGVTIENNHLIKTNNRRRSLTPSFIQNLLTRFIGK